MGLFSFVQPGFVGLAWSRQNRGNPFSSVRFIQEKLAYFMLAFLLSIRSGKTRHTLEDGMKAPLLLRFGLIRLPGPLA
jgi:hypothetical protein